MRQWHSGWQAHAAGWRNRRGGGLIPKEARESRGPLVATSSGVERRERITGRNAQVLWYCTEAHFFPADRREEFRFDFFSIRGISKIQFFVSVSESAQSRMRARSFLIAFLNIKSGLMTAPTSDWNWKTMNHEPSPRRFNFNHYHHIIFEIIKE